MDITKLLDTLIVGASAHPNTTVEKMREETYRNLKALIQRKLANNADWDLIFAQYEQQPEVWKSQLKEILTQLHADQDADITTTALKLMALIQPQRAMKDSLNVNEGSQAIVQSKISGGTFTFNFSDIQSKNKPFLAPPLPPYNLVGRESLFSSLKQRLLADESLGLSALNGLPGVGKTALAVALVHDREVLAHFDDGVLWAGLGPNADVLAHLSRWAVAVGIPSAEIAQKLTLRERALAIQERIGLRRMLLVVDDAWQLEEALTFKVGGPHCSYLVTTRLPKVAQGFAGDGSVGIQELSGDQGLILLKRLAPVAVETELENALELVQWVDGLPLALTLMGNYLRSETHDKQPRRLTSALERLRQAKERLKLAWPQGPLEQHPSLPAGVSLSLMASIDVSYHALSRDARSMLLAFSPFPAKPNTFSEEAAIFVSAMPPRILDKLTDSGLVESSGPGRYTLHLIINDYARLKCTRKTPYERMVDFFVSYLKVHQSDYMLLDQEMSNVLVALHTAYERGMHKSLVQGANGFTPFLQSRGLYEIAEIHLNRARQAAQSLGDTTSLVRLLRGLGNIAQARGMYLQAEGYLQEGLLQARKIGDTKSIISLLSIKGSVAQSQGEFAKAEEHFQEGLALARKIENPELISVLFNNMGYLAASLGDHLQSEEYWQEGLALARQVRNTERCIPFLINLGTNVLQQRKMMSDQQRKAQAEKYYEEALILARQTGNLSYLNILLTNLALLQEDSIQRNKYLQEAIPLALQIGDPLQIIHTLQSLGSVAQGRGDFSQAKKYLQDGLVLARQIGNPESIIISLLILAELEEKQDNATKAEHYCQEGLALARQINHLRHIRDILTNLSRLATIRRAYTQAEEYLREARALARKLGDEKTVFLQPFADLGKIAEQYGDCNQARTYYQEGLALARESGIDKAIMLHLIGLGILEDEQGNYMQAEIYFLEHLALERKMGLRKEIAILLSNLGDVAKKRRDYVRAEEYFKEGLVLTRELGLTNITSELLKDLGDVAQMREDYIQAKKYYEEGLNLARQMEDSEDICKWLSALGSLYLKQQLWNLAASAFQEAFTVSQEIKNHEMAATSLYGLAQIAVAQGNITQALEQGQVSLRLFEALNHEKTIEVKQWLAALTKTINDKRDWKKLH